MSAHGLDTDPSALHFLLLLLGHPTSFTKASNSCYNFSMASEGKDVQAGSENKSKGPATPSEQTPPRPSPLPIHSPQHDSAVVDQDADRPSLEQQRVQTDEWVLNIASRRRAGQARRDLSNKAVNKTSSAPQNRSKLDQGSERTNRKTHIKSLRQAVRGSTALPRSIAPDMMTTRNQHKNVTTHRDLLFQL